MVSYPSAPALPQTFPRSCPRDAGSCTSVALHLAALRRQRYRKAHQMGGRFLNKGFFLGDTATVTLGTARGKKTLAAPLLIT